MKHLRNIRNVCMVLCSLLMVACEDDNPKLEDIFLVYDIPEIPVTRDYHVGVEYAYAPSSYSSSPFGNAMYKELFFKAPVLGEYTHMLSLVPDGSERVLDAHLRWIKQAKIDFMVLTLRPDKFNTGSNSSFCSDTANVHRIVEAPGFVGLHFAFKYDFGSTILGSNAPTKNDSSMIIENKPNGVENFIADFTESMTPYFDMPNYQRIDGKPVVYLNNAYRLYTRNSPALYKRLRAALKAKGYEVYIVGQQEKWSPPARYEHYLRNSVDAIYHDNYVNVPSNDFNRVYMFHQACDQAWQYSRNYFANWGTDYVPNISPSWNQNLGSPSANGAYYNPYIVRTDDFFRKCCNVAKNNAGKNGMILISSWNNWAYDAQIEPASSYGTIYLDIIPQQFKR